MTTTSHSTPLTADVLIRHIAGEFEYSLPGCLERCDLIQIGWVAYLEAERRYRPEQGSIWTYAYERIRGSMLDAIRKAFKQSAPLQMLPAEDSETSLVDPQPTPDAVLLKKELLRTVMNAACGSARKETLRLYQAGWQQKDIARHLHVSEGRISQWLTEIRQNLAFSE